MSIIDDILKGESKTIEFKEKIPNNESLAKTTIAFSNTSGGKIIIGVNDKREIVGIDNEIDIFELQDKVASIIYDNCYPNIIPEIYTTNLEGKLLLVVEIFRGSLLPYYLKREGKNNGTYIRIGATNRKASYENIIELERQRRNICYDEEINYDINFENVDYSPLVKKFNQLGKQLDIEKMKNLKLIKEKNGKLYATNGLVILLGLQENCTIKCSRFKGTTMEYFLDRKEYIGDLFSQLDNAENFIKNHINVQSKIQGLQRIDIYEVPQEAIREALVNAIVHRDYTNFGRDIKIGIYDDILNIVSPGGFPNTLTENDILQGRSEVRNRVIARVFKELNYIEQWGSGINRIKLTCTKMGLKEPVIKETGDFVNVDIYRNLDGTGYMPKDAGYMPKDAGYISNVFKDLTEQQKIIIEYLLKNEKITTQDVCNLLLVKERRARDILKTLTDKYLIKKVGAGPNTFYKLEREQ